MLKRNTFLVVVFLTAANFCIAQLQPVRYSGMLNTGAVFGSNNTKLQVQTIHGIRSGAWALGAGVAIDDYFLQSFPVFIDLRRDIFKTKSSPFVYGEGGINIVGKDHENNYEKIDNKAGVFYEGGIGYKIGLNGQLAFNIAAGYSYKGYKDEKSGSMWHIPGEGSYWGGTGSSSNRYMLRRLVLKIGLQF